MTSTNVETPIITNSFMYYAEEDKDMIVNEISLVIQNIILETTGH